MRDANRFPTSQAQQHVQFMCLQTLKIIPLVTTLRKARPTESATDSSFECEFHGVSAQVNGSIVAAPPEKDFCISKMPSRHATEFHASEHASPNEVGLSATGILPSV